MNILPLVRFTQESRATPQQEPPVRLPPWIPAQDILAREHGKRSLDRPHGHTAPLDPGPVIIEVKPGDRPALEESAEPLSLPTGTGPKPGEVERNGTDALAFYLPFHFYRRVWGIYLRASGVVSLAESIKGSALASTDTDVLAASWRVLYEHERFHFVLEAGAATLELNDIRNVYGLHFADGDARLQEEALCNAHAVRRGSAGKCKGFRPNIEGFMQAQGPGYSEYGKYVRGRAFSDGQREISRNMLLRDSDTPPASNAVSFHLITTGLSKWPGETLFAPFTPGAVDRQVPLFLVMDVPVPFLRVIRAFPKAHGLQVFVRVNDHPPPHFHVDMPPGTKYGRFQWPSLDPYPGDPALGASGRKSLDAYLDQHKRKVVERLRTVYPGQF